MVHLDTEDKSHIYNQQCKTIEMVLSRPIGHFEAVDLKITDEPRVSPLGDHMTRKYDNGDQPSGGETPWDNTGAT